MKTIQLLFTFLLAFSFSGKVLGQTNFVGSQTVNSGQNMTASLFIDTVAGTVEITLSGPDNVWFGYGFGGSAMSGTYAIITDGSGGITERNLGNHTSGTLLTSSITTVSNTVNGSVRTVVVNRALAGLNANYYTFPNATASIPMIWAHGTGSTLAYHGAGNRGASTLSVTPDCTGNNTFATIDASACEFYVAPSFTQVWTTSGTYNDVITNAFGCDSVLNH